MKRKLLPWEWVCRYCGTKNEIGIMARPPYWSQCESYMRALKKLRTHINGSLDGDWVRAHHWSLSLRCLLDGSSSLKADYADDFGAPYVIRDLALYVREKGYTGLRCGSEFMRLRFDGKHCFVIDEEFDIRKFRVGNSVDKDITEFCGLRPIPANVQLLRDV